MDTKLRRGFGLVHLLIVCAILGLMAAFTMPVRAQTYSPTNLFLPTYWQTNTWTLTNAETRTINPTNFAITLRQGQGMAVFMKSVALTTNSTAGASVTATFSPTPDKVTFPTSSPFTFPESLNGQTAVILYTNWGAMGPQPLLANVPTFALTQLANTHTGSVTVTLWFSRNNQ